MGDDPRPPASGFNFEEVEGVGCMALITLRCYGDASSPEQRSALRAIHPPQHPQHYICLLGGSGSSPINLTRRHEAQCLVWGVRGVFPPSAAMVVTVFCSVPEHKPLFLVEPRTTAWWVSPESSRLEQDNSCTVLRQRRRDKREKIKNRKETSAPYVVGMLFI
jgi:hypothetical protein